VSRGELVIDESEARRAERPVLRVVRGIPTPEELAALVTVVAARSAGSPPPGEPASLWRDRAAVLRAPLAPGPGSWRASGLPR
jgi:hypothetical protein